MIIIVIIVMAFLFHPVHYWLLGKKMKPGLAAFLTMLIMILAVLIPIVIAILIMSLQMGNLVNQINNNSLDIVNADSLGSNVIVAINTMLSGLHIPYQVTEASFNQFLANMLQGFANAVLKGLSSFIGNFFSIFTALIIYLIVFHSLLTHRVGLIDGFKRINPLGVPVTTVYLHKMGAMTKAMVRGQFTIAFTQGLISAISLYAVGFRGVFFFFLILLTLISIVPLGAGVITIPLGIILILNGQVWQGAVIILTNILIVNTIDNALRPILVPPQVRLNAALTTLAAFGGLATFGIIGIILGPVLMIVTVTTIEMFLDVYRGSGEVGHKTYPHETNPFKRVFKRFSKKAPETQA